MAKNYKKRLKAHKLRLFKKLFSVSLFPLILILFIITIQLLRPAPDKWETESIVLDSIGSTSVMGHKSSKTVAKIVNVDGQSYVLSQMKPDEASSVLTTGDKYDIVYSSEFGRLRIKGLYKNGAEIISTNDSVSGYKSLNITATILCSAIFVIMLVALAFTVAFECKDEIKYIKRLRKKLQTPQK